jgi:hypothetical protein
MKAEARRLFALCAVLLLSALAVGCQRSKGILAELETRNGNVTRDYSAKVGTWESAPVSSTFKVGDGVRTGKQSRALLRLSDHSAVKLDDETLIRFLAKPPGSNAQGLDVQSGQAELEVGAEALLLDTGLGIAHVQPGTRLRLTKTASSTRLSVLIGSAELDGNAAPVRAGESLEIGIGRAVIDPAASAAPTPRPPGAAAPSAAASETQAELVAQADASVGDGKAPAERVRSRGPEAIDIAASAGESLLIHDPRPPTAIGFSTAKCAGSAVIEVGARKVETVGEGSVHASFPAGVNHYRVLCSTDDKPIAQGTVSVLHDAGNRRLPTSPPATRVDTDGRRYTVLYQNLLPQMSVRWPGAPQSGPFALSVRSGAGVQRFTSAAPSYSFAPGALHEGSHELWFEAPGARSQTTVVVVQFDNAAPTASITAPADGSFAPGASVAISGTALPGWSVSVSGQELAQDAQHRFSGQAQTTAGLRALAIRFESPQRGTQYYLRRGAN